VGNYNQTNQLLINTDGVNFQKNDLIGGAKFTYYIVIADIDNDGELEIIFGNGNENKNQLLRNVGSSSDNIVIDLPGGTMDTRSINVADVNNDGWLDIVIGNEDQVNQLLRNSFEKNFINVGFVIP
jgi:hypothetical protein